MKMPYRKITGGLESKKLILDAVKQMADVVGSTMGARGRNVLLQSLVSPRPDVVNDGVKIAREFYHEEPVANMAVQLVKEASIKTNDQAGDGTTCATVLAGAILEEGYKHIMQGASPVLLRNTLNREYEEIAKRLENMATPVETKDQLINIAKISVQSDSLGEIIGDTMHKVGKDGAVSVENNVKNEIVVEHALGARFSMGHLGGALTDPEKFEARYDDVRFLVMNYGIEDHEFDTKWLPFARKLVTVNAENVVQKVNVPTLVIITEKLSMRVIQFINDPQNRSLVKFLWVQPPSFGEKRKDILKDFCALTGAKLVDKDDGVYLNRLSVEDLGHAKSATVTKTHTTVSLEGAEASLATRIDEIKAQIANSNNQLDIDNMKERLAVLTGGVATIKVGGATESEVKELKLRIEDAINACRSAMEKGIVPGGGVALLDAVTVAKTQGAVTVGYSFCDSFTKPFKQILLNAGYEPDAIHKFIEDRQLGDGFDVKTLEPGKMMAMGIIDPVKVILRALGNAVSVAGLLFTADYAVVVENDKIDTLKEILGNKTN
jgi:chaperonin GroEL